MDRTISQSQPSAQASSFVAAARDVVLAIVLLAVMAWLAIDVALLAAIAHGN